MLRVSGEGGEGERTRLYFSCISSEGDGKWNVSLRRALLWRGNGAALLFRRVEMVLKGYLMSPSPRRITSENLGLESSRRYSSGAKSSERARPGKDGGGGCTPRNCLDLNNFRRRHFIES